MALRALEQPDPASPQTPLLTESTNTNPWPSIMSRVPIFREAAKLDHWRCSLRLKYHFAEPASPN
jgi:hypothetical protein